MRKLIEFQILDENAKYYGLDFLELMKTAGGHVAKHVKENVDVSTPVIFLCGHGNNGGDGYIAAEILRRENYNVKLYAVKKPTTKTSLKASDSYRSDIINIDEWKKSIESSTLIVDCLLGSGTKGELRPPYDKLVQKVNRFENILSVDVPTGFGNINAVKPQATITFHDMKLGMKKSNCGEIFVKDVGFSSEVDELTGPGELLLFPDFDSKKHKGQNGKVAVIGGGQYSGAPSLAAIGAYRGGADLVHVFVPEGSYAQVSSFVPELIVHKLNGEVISKGVLTELEKENFDSIVIGPGMGKHEDSIEAVQFLIENFDNIVIDADAINLYEFGSCNLLLTPHLGELSRLKIKNSRDDLMGFAKSNNVTLLLKGEKDSITDGDYFKINTTGHARMAVGGTGDLLAGLCGGLIAKGLSSYEAGRLGAYTLGKAGELCYEEYGASFLPTDLSLCISKILSS